MTENDTNKYDIMANEEALGPRKTMFVLVIVVGCFAVLWPRILSPLLLGNTQQQLKPNKFDRDAGNDGIFNSDSMSISLEMAVEKVRFPLYFSRVFIESRYFHNYNILL